MFMYVTDFGDMSEDAAAGLKSVLMRRSSALESLCQQAVSMYSVKDHKCYFYV